MSQAANKTANVSLFAWADVASTVVTIGTPLDVSTAFEIGIAIRLARRTGTAFTAGWPNIRIEGSYKTSGNDVWFPIYIHRPAVGATIVNTTLNGAVAANDATFVVTSASNIAAGDLLFLGDASAANYEVVRVKSVSGTTITPEENVTFSHANAALVTDQAEIIGLSLGVSSIQRIRVVADNAGSGQAISVQVLAGTFDSVGA